MFFFLLHQALQTAGLQGNEAVGGHLYLTTYRLVFESHQLNWVTGRLSIFLPAIQAVRNSSHVITKQLAVQTRTQEHMFVVWGIPKLMAAILAARDRLSAQQQAALREVAVAEFAKCGVGLGVERALADINGDTATVQQLEQLLDVATEPFEVTTVVGLLELFST